MFGLGGELLLLYLLRGIVLTGLSLVYHGLAGGLQLGLLFFIAQLLPGSLVLTRYCPLYYVSRENLSIRLGCRLGSLLWTGAAWLSGQVVEQVVDLRPQSQPGAGGLAGELTDFVNVFVAVTQAMVQAAVTSYKDSP